MEEKQGTVLWRLVQVERLTDSYAHEIDKKKEENGRNEDIAFRCFTWRMGKTFWCSCIKNILTGKLLQAMRVVRLQQT